MDPLTMLVLVSPLLTICIAICIYVWKDGDRGDR